MNISRYSNSFVQNTSIELGLQELHYGTLLSEYEVNEHWDLRTASDGGTQGRRAYSVTLRQRLTLYSEGAGDVASLTEGTSYTYPILAINSVTPSSSAENLEYYLEDYSPKTLNASVTASQSQNSNSSSSTSIQTTRGSTTETTNTYEKGGSVGLMPTFNPSKTKSTTSIVQNPTTTDGSNIAWGSEASAGSSMSIKDWGAYGFIDADKRQVSWAWGQEHPWNIIDYRLSAGSGGEVELPPYVQGLLFDGTFLYPPSQIAQFGLNFVAHARWLFYLDGSAGPVDEIINFQHVLTYLQASHSIPSPGTKPLSASVIPVASNEEIECLALNLPVLALEPISSKGGGNGAVVGFIKSEFITRPNATGASFRLKSNANNVYVNEGKGFDPLIDDDAVLAATNITESSPASYTIQFKIADPKIELSLYLKHWKTSSDSCVLVVNVNNQTVTRHVDEMNAAAGSDNITTISLRSLDYASADFYDYLVMGVNVISVTVLPADGAASSGYSLRALAIQ